MQAGTEICEGTYSTEWLAVVASCRDVVLQFDLDLRGLLKAVLLMRSDYYQRHMIDKRGLIFNGTLGGKHPRCVFLETGQV